MKNTTYRVETVSVSAIDGVGRSQIRDFQLEVDARIHIEQIVHMYTNSGYQVKERETEYVQLQNYKTDDWFEMWLEEVQA